MRALVNLMDRDDKHKRNFQARAQQPRQLSGAPQTQHSTMDINLHVYDGYRQGMNEMDGTGYRHTGVSPHLTQYNQRCQRRNLMSTINQFD